MPEKVKTNLPATGAIGVAPPPDAPKESAQPLSPETLAFQQAQARGNERELKPFNPPPLGPPPTQAMVDDFFGKDAAPLILTDAALPTQDRVRDLEQQLAALKAERAVQAPPTVLPDPLLPPVTAEDRLRMPAASDSESPARGILPNLVPEKADKFDGIARGGFTDLAEETYFPLTGDELRQLVDGLMDQIHAQIQNDLRFSIALTYPRVRATVQVIIEGAAEDNNAGMTIQKIAVPKEGQAGSTPLDIARRYADDVVFVVTALRQEFTPEGESQSPPDQIRADLGIARPRKVMSTVGNRMSVYDITE